jgi:hypothetical protein
MLGHRDELEISYDCDAMPLAIRSNDSVWLMKILSNAGYFSKELWIKKAVLYCIELDKPEILDYLRVKDKELLYACFNNNALVDNELNRSSIMLDELGKHAEIKGIKIE